MARWILMATIVVYQRCVSPFLVPVCRYYPTCSQYALGCVEKYGVVKGAWLALRRLLRCVPIFPGGYDPVP